MGILEVVGRLNTHADFHIAAVVHANSGLMIGSFFFRQLKPILNCRSGNDPRLTRGESSGRIRGERRTDISNPDEDQSPFLFDDAPMGWSSRSPIEAGWYFNAERTYQAYWDGERWTGVTRPPPPSRPPSRGNSPWVWVVVVLLTLAVLFVLTARLAQ